MIIISGRCNTVCTIITVAVYCSCYTHIFCSFEPHCSTTGSTGASCRIPAASTTTTRTPPGDRHKIRITEGCAAGSAAAGSTAVYTAGSTGASIASATTTAAA